jgi:hypothetical protein
MVAECTQDAESHVQHGLKHSPCHGLGMFFCFLKEKMDAFFLAPGWPGVAHELSSCRRGKRLAYTGGWDPNQGFSLQTERLDVEGLQASLMISHCWHRHRFLRTRL